MIIIACHEMILLFLVYCSVSEDEIDMYELTEADGDLQIVTECWVEPQYGVVVNSTPERQHWEGLTYKQIARAVSHFLVYGIYYMASSRFIEHQFSRILWLS